MREKELKSLEPLLQAAGSINNPYLKKAKAEGRPIVGLVYHEIPEELLTAAGCVPVFLRGTGGTGTELAESYFRQITCNYTRYTFNQVIEGAWSFLDGAVVYNSCDHMRRIYDNWKLLPDCPAYHFIYIPKKRGEIAKERYLEELKKLIAATEERFGVKVTDEKLAAAIRLHNETRRLQSEIYAMQKADAVPLLGHELLQVMLAGVSMPREDYNALLRALIAEIKEGGEAVLTKPRVRLLYAGGHADSPQFFAQLDGLGAQIVTDNAGFGTRACEGQVREDADPFHAIADYYFDEKPAATRQLGTQRERMERYEKLIGEFRIDGVILTRIAMCDVWAFEQFMARDFLQRKNVPLLELETDYAPDSMGQIRTRYQAFVESIESRNEH